eukprot:4994068-Pleurochrysis_carterae.AAC.6
MLRAAGRGGESEREREREKGKMAQSARHGQRPDSATSLPPCSAPPVRRSKEEQAIHSACTLIFGFDLLADFGRGEEREAVRRADGQLGSQTRHAHEREHALTL